MTDLTTLPDPTAPDFGEQLARWREAADLSTEKLAILLAVSPRTIYRWEHGQQHPATVGYRHTTRVAPVLARIQALRAENSSLTC